MREGVRRRGVGEIVGRHIDRLDRGDRAPVGRADALLQFGEFGAQRRLVADAEGMRPSRPDTSEPACTKRKMLSISSSTSRRGRRGNTRPWSARRGRRESARRGFRSSGRTPSPCSPARPASPISRYSSSASRERSPMPQNRLTPSYSATMLWIISVISTVLPTPAPPKSPALPPRSSGESRSMALIPVSK
jgi:hypothetical protein